MKNYTVSFTLSAVLALALVTTLASCSTATGTSTQASSVQASSVSTPSAQSGTATTVSGTKNTSFSADQTVSYNAPQGNDSIEFAVTVTNGTVTKLTVTPKASGVSAGYQSHFASAASTQIVGKSLSDISGISAVSGASLTTEAFKKFIVSAQG